MGLGKTLTMLTVIVQSLPRAIAFAIAGTTAPSDYWRMVTPSKSTLVIVPSSRKSLKM
jgi:hypothetical protein